MFICFFLSNLRANGNTSGTRVFILITRVSDFVENPGLTRVLETRGPPLTATLNLCLIYFKITWAQVILIDHMHKKFD